MGTRRQFIKDVSLVSGGLILSSSLLANCLCIGNKKVIIIGAGFAGLMAAYTLYLKNIDFEILESRGRIGGRVLSHVFDGPDKLVVELGGEWITTDHKLIFSLCKEFCLELVPNTFSPQAIYKGKHFDNLYNIPSSTPEWNLKFKSLLTDYNNMKDKEKDIFEKKLDNMDWWSYLKESGCSNVDLEIRDILDSTIFGENIKNISAFEAISDNSSRTFRNLNFKIRGGNILLAHKFRELFVSKIKTGKHIIKVEQKNGVTVYCNDGYIAEGDKLICTAPTYALSKIKWQPELPEPMSNAIESLKYARISKEAVLLNSKLWKNDFEVYTDLSGQYLYNGAQNDTTNKGALISLAVGEQALLVADQSKEWRAENIIQSLNPAFPNEKMLIEQQILQDWVNDEYSKGAYSIYGKGQWFDLFPSLKRPHLHTHFAGEHLSKINCGYMEGALESGQEAANEIMKLL